MKEKNKLIVLVCLIGVAAVVWYFGSRGPSAAASLALASELKYTPLGVENPALQRAKLEASRKTEYQSAGRDLFSEVAPPPPQQEVAKKEEVRTPVGPMPQPPPPPIPDPTLPPNVKFFGYGTIPNGTARRAFLTDGEEVFIVGEGDLLLGKYRVVKIGNANLEFEEVASGRRGSTVLSEEQSAAPPA